MAQTNYTPIQLYYSSTAAAVPVNTNLLNGELAINITDGKLYYKDNSGTVQVIATKGAGTIGGSTTQVQFNDAGALAGSSGMTYNKTTTTLTVSTLNLTNALGTIYGGTGLTSYTAGDLLYSSASNTLAKLAIGTASYILTVNSGGTNVQWSAPSSISVSTATNLAGGVAGSVPYQSGASTTVFLGIGAADRVMTSSGTAPQWVTALTGLTGVSSSSITNTGLTSGRVVYTTTGGLETASANLAFDGTTLTTTGLSNTGTSTIVKLLTVGNTSFNGTTVFAAATPAKLYMGTGTVTDVTSAVSATNATGAIASLAITPIAATNTGVTYTNASTLYIAGAPSAGTNITITNPYALYVAAGASYFGADLTVYGLTVGRGAGAVSTNTAVGASALAANGAGANNTGIGKDSLLSVVSGSNNTALGSASLKLTTGSDNTGIGYLALIINNSGSYNTSVGSNALYNNTTASNNTAVGYQAGYTGTTATQLTAFGVQAGYTNNANNNAFFGYQAGYKNASGTNNAAFGAYRPLYENVSGSFNTAIGDQAGYYSTGGNNTFLGYKAGFGAVAGNTGTNIVAIGDNALLANTSGGQLVAIGTNAMIANTSGQYNVAVGQQALNGNTTASNNTAVGYQAGYSNTTSVSNVSIGYQAMYGLNTGAGGNVAIGDSAMYDVKQTAGTNIAIGLGTMRGVAAIGAGNIAIGQATMYPLTTGSNNTIVGGYAGIFTPAGRQLTSGSNNAGFGASCLAVTAGGSGNTAMGMQTLYQSNADFNTAIGYLAGYNVTSGVGNTFLGGLTGQFGGGAGPSTGSYNTYIGYGSISSSAGVTGELVVTARGSDNSTTGKGASTGFISPAGGGVYQGNNGATWSVTSDQRLKKNIVDNNVGLEKITAIQVRNFEYRLPEEVDAELKPTDAIEKSGVQLGVIAQELQQVLPDCVKTESTGVMAVDADNLTWYLVNAVKELKAEFDAYKASHP